MKRVLKYRKPMEGVQKCLWNMGEKVHNMYSCTVNYMMYHEICEMTVRK